MILKNFRFRVIIRVILIAVCMAALIFALYQDQWYVASSVSFIFVFLLIFELIRYVEKINRELGKFLFAVKHKDFTNTFNLKDEGKSFSVLNDAFTEIIMEFQNVRIEKEVHYQYLNAVVNHINIAVICFEKNGKVQLFNKTACILLNINQLSNIGSLKEIHPELYNTISKIETGKNQLVKIKINESVLHLSFHCMGLKLRNTDMKLVSFQNIKNELEAHELESWQRLIRVLTHEIMNSVTPIFSLSEAINEMLQQKNINDSSDKSIDEDDFNDLTNSMNTIANRSKGLINFVKSYKDLTKLPRPEFEEMNIKDIISGIILLLKNDLEKSDIIVRLNFQEENLLINADRKMTEQVLINIIKNAIEILNNTRSPAIDISVASENSNISISIMDNGPGIDEEKLEKIFIPFYTTKQNGSGIGLSLSRQIMRLHGGSISVNSEPGKGTVFTLAF